MLDIAKKAIITPITSDELHPLWHSYAGQDQCQDTYIEFDLSNGELRPHWNAEVGSGVPSAVWHNIRLLYPIAPDLTKEEINALLDAVAPLAQTLLDGSDIVWDGSRSVGIYAEAVHDQIGRLCDETRTASLGVMDASHWLYPEHVASEYSITATTTDDQLDAICVKIYDSAVGEATLLRVEEYVGYVRDQLRIAAEA